MMNTWLPAIFLRNTKIPPCREGGNGARAQEICMSILLRDADADTINSVLFSENFPEGTDTPPPVNLN